MAREKPIATALLGLDGAAWSKRLGLLSEISLMRTDRFFFFEVQGVPPKKITNRNHLSADDARLIAKIEKAALDFLATCILIDQVQPMIQLVVPTNWMPR